jgi:hypothetical protein
MEELLRAAMPPDEDMLDLIELAFLEGQIDGLKVDLACIWLGGALEQISEEMPQRILLQESN